MSRNIHIHIPLRFLLPLVMLVAGVVAACPVAGQGIAVYDSIRTYTVGMSPEQVLRLGESLEQDGRREEAIAAYNEAANLFRADMSREQKQTCVQAHMNLSSLWLHEGNLINALQVFMNALEIAEDIRDEARTLRILNNMGYIYLSFKHYEEAAECFKKSESINAALHDPNADFLIFNNLAGAYASLGDSSEAKRYLEKLRGLEVTDPAIRVAAPYYIGLLDGVVLNGRGRFAQGAEHIRRAIEYASSHSLGKELECFAYEELYKSYLGQGDLDSTIWALHRFHDTAKEARIPEKEVEALKEIYKAYELTGDTAGAADYKSRYLTMADSVMNFREFARLNSIRVFHETSKYKSEISALNTEGQLKSERIRRQFTTILWILSILVLIAGLLALVWWQKRRLHQSYRHLFKIHSEMMEAEKTRMAPGPRLRAQGGKICGKQSAKRGGGASGRRHTPHHGGDPGAVQPGVLGAETRRAHREQLALRLAGHQRGHGHEFLGHAQ